jgi:hypothetical protein
MEQAVSKAVPRLPRCVDGAAMRDVSHADVARAVLALAGLGLGAAVVAGIVLLASGAA